MRSWVGDVDLVAAPAGVVAEVGREGAGGGGVGGVGGEGDVGGVDLGKRAEGEGAGGVGQGVVVEVIAARGFAVVVEAGEEGEGLGEAVGVVGGLAGDGAELALADEALAEVGEETEIVGAEEAGEVELLGRGEGPGVGGGEQGGVGLVVLTRIDGVAGVDDVRVAGVGSEERDETGDIRDAVVGDSEEGEAMRTEGVEALRVELVLLAVLEAMEEAVAVAELKGEHGVGRGREAGDEVEVALVAGQGEEGIKSAADGRIRRLD